MTPIVQKMLENPNIKEWFDEMTYHGAEITSTVYIRRLSAILKRINETPESLTEIDRNDLYRKMMIYVKEEQENKKTPSYITSELKAIYSYLKFKEVIFKRLKPIKNAMSTPTVQNETIPTKEELSKLLQMATPRDKVSISLMAFAGLRPATIGDHHGKNGLVMGDIDGWRIEKNEILIEPTLMISIRPEISKISRPYFTYLSEEGGKHLANYLNMRLRNGEKITNNSPVVKGIFRGQISHLGTNALRNGIRISYKKIGLDKRPYTLRRYFASKMLQGEDNGLITRSHSEYFMGHKGSMMDRYSVQKGLLPEQTQEMKDAYNRCSIYLHTSVTQEEIKILGEKIKKSEQKGDSLEEMHFSLMTKLKDVENENKELKNQIIKMQSDVNESLLMKQFLIDGDNTKERIKKVMELMNDLGSTTRK